MERPGGLENSAVCSYLLVPHPWIQPILEPSLADMEGLYFSIAKAGSLREQANGGDSDRRGKDQGIRICSTEVSGFHQIVEWEPVEEL